MRIKIIGDNNCARATRHLLRLAGFAVTEFLPADAVTQGPHAGYAITIDLAPATHTPNTFLRPDTPAHHLHASTSEEAPRLHRDASSPTFVRQSEWRTTAGRPAFGGASVSGHEFGEAWAGTAIQFDSVDSALEDAVLRHVTQLAAVPVIVDRPGGVVHSDRELRIVAPNTGDSKADEAAAVAIEFGVLRGLLDLTAPAARRKVRGNGAGTVCGTSATGVSGFGGATAATGWNFAANGGIALGNGDSSLGAEGTSGDNLCVFNSGSGQVSGGISYVVQ